MVASYENHEKLDIIPKSIQSKTSNTLLFDNSSSNSETSHGSASSVKEEEFIIAIPDTKQIQTPIQEATNTNDNSELIDLLFQAKIPDIYKKENTAITESLQNIIKVYAFRYPKIHTAIRSLIRKKVEQHINTLYSSSDKKKSIELLIKYLVMYHSITP
jgi:hypothetical protein